MKQTEYKVIYLNGNEDIFYCVGVIAAFVAAVHNANNMGRDSRIKYIEDEFGTVYTEFNFTYKTKQPC